MQKKTRSILEELDTLYQEKHSDQDRRYIIESRAANVIASAIRLVEQIESSYTPEQQIIWCASCLMQYAPRIKINLQEQ